MGKVYLNQKQMAAVLGRSTRSVRSMHERGIPYETKDGKPRYPVPECVEWFFHGSDEEKQDMAEARRRYAVAKAEREELRLGRERGEVPRQHPEFDQRLADILLYLDVALKKTASRFTTPLAKVARISRTEALHIMHGVVQAQRAALGGRAQRIHESYTLPGPGDEIDAGD